MSSDGVLDFSGGTVISMSMPVLPGLVQGQAHRLRHSQHGPHNFVFSLIGASLLWGGWFGFNAGSAGGSKRTCGHCNAEYPGYNCGGSAGVDGSLVGGIQKAKRA